MTVSLRQNVSERPLDEKLEVVVRYLNREATPLLRKLRSLVVLNYAVTFGDGVATTYTHQHGLGTADVVWSLRNVSTGVYLDDSDITSVTVDESGIEIVLAVAPAADSVRLVMLAV